MNASMSRREMAVDTLRALPWLERMTAYDHFDDAMTAWRLARWNLRHRLPGWRLDHIMEMRRAIRAWRKYSAAVKKARQAWRTAA